MVISRGSAPRFPRHGRAEQSPGCFCAAPDISMSSSAYGALDAGHQGPSDTWGQLESCPVGSGPRGSESAAPHFPYPIPAEPWQRPEITVRVMAVALPCPHFPSPIQGGRDSFTLPACLRRVVGPSPALWLLNFCVTRLCPHLSEPSCSLHPDCHWGYST